MPRKQKYEVGYRKPPKKNQWKKGQSGNPKGRPKGTKNLSTDLMEELSEMIHVNEGGERKRISKQRAVLKQLAAKALEGDLKAMQTLLTLAIEVIESKEREKEEDRLAGFDDDILKNYLEKQNGRKK